MTGVETAATVISNALLFLLVFGMSSTVDIRNMKQQLQNWRAICTGLFCQFVLLPFLGFCCVKIFNFPPSVGITLLIVVSSPGGSYSNWWCSLLNADLALSVAMTAISTILCVGFLPANVMLYTTAAYRGESQDGESVIRGLNFGALFISIFVVIGAISLGMFCSYKFDSPTFHKMTYIGGNISGIALILFSTVLSFVSPSNDGSNPSNLPEESDPGFYFGVGLPCIFGLLFASIISSLIRISKPERLTTAVECCYQNTGIATSAAISLFSGDELQKAMRVPLIYGIVEIVSIGSYMLVFWKLGWSKAPRDEKFCTVITKSYELAPGDKEETDVDDDQVENGAVEMTADNDGTVTVFVSNGSGRFEEDKAGKNVEDMAIDEDKVLQVTLPDSE